MSYKSKPTLRDHLERFINRRKGWIPKGVLEDETVSLGYLADTGARILRKMAEQGLIKRRIEKSRSRFVSYQRY